jgi:hypothetical protein
MAKLSEVILRDALASRPAAGLAGRLFYDTTNSILYRDSGADWEAIEGEAPSATGEIMLTAAGGWPSTTGGCAANAKVEYGTNDVDLYALDFDPDADEYAQWTVWMPDDWDGGTIAAKFAWTAASGSGDVVWAIQGRAYANDDPIDAAWGTAQTATDALTATGDLCISGATPDCTLAGTPAAGQFVQLRVYRDANAAGDTLAADARLLAVKITYGRS